MVAREVEGLGQLVTAAMVRAATADPALQRLLAPLVPRGDKAPGAEGQVPSKLVARAEGLDLLLSQGSYIPLMGVTAIEAWRGGAGLAAGGPQQQATSRAALLAMQGPPATPERVIALAQEAMAGGDAGREEPEESVGPLGHDPRLMPTAVRRLHRELTEL